MLFDNRIPGFRVPAADKMHRAFRGNRTIKFSRRVNTFTKVRVEYLEVKTMLWGGDHTRMYKRVDRAFSLRRHI